MAGFEEPPANLVAHFVTFCKEWARIIGEEKTMSDKVPLPGRYYGGVLMNHELILAGDADSVPFEGDYLLIEVHGEGHDEGHDAGIVWSLHSVGEDAGWACGGKAWVEPRGGAMTLVLGEPLQSGGSALVPGFPLNPEVAAAYLAGLMTGLPDWPFEVKLPDSLRSHGRLQPA